MKNRKNPFANSTNSYKNSSLVSVLVGFQNVFPLTQLFDTKSHILSQVMREKLEIVRSGQAFDRNLELFQNQFEIIILMLNDFSYFLMKSDEPKIAIKVLEKCMCYILDFKLHQKHTYFMSLVYNHIAACYRKIGELKIAIQYLIKASLLPRNPE